MRVIVLALLLAGCATARVDTVPAAKPKIVKSGMTFKQLWDSRIKHPLRLVNK
jgi:hypothetical protein